MPDEKKEPSSEVEDMAKELFKTPQELLAGSTVYTYDVEDTFGAVGVESGVVVSTGFWFKLLQTPVEPGAAQEFANIKSRVDLSNEF